MAFTIWTNGKFDPAATRLFEEGTVAHRVVAASAASASVLAHGESDPALATADIAFGQPDPADCLRYSNVKWVEVSTAGYTRYDTPQFLEGFRARGSAFTAFRPPVP